MKDFGINPVTGTIALWVLFIAVIVIVASIRYASKVRRGRSQGSDENSQEPEEYY